MRWSTSVTQKPLTNNAEVPRGGMRHVRKPQWWGKTWRQNRSRQCNTAMICLIGRRIDGKAVRWRKYQNEPCALLLLLQFKHFTMEVQILNRLFGNSPLVRRGRSIEWISLTMQRRKQCQGPAIEQREGRTASEGHETAEQDEDYQS